MPSAVLQLYEVSYLTSRFRDSGLRKTDKEPQRPRGGDREGQGGDSRRTPDATVGHPLQLHRIGRPHYAVKGEMTVFAFKSPDGIR